MRLRPLFPSVPSLVLAAAALAACGRDGPAPSSSETGGGPPSASPAPPGGGGSGRAPAAVPSEASPWALASNPGAGVEVLAAKTSPPKESVVVVGRVREMLERRAGFSMIDTSIPYCGQTEKEGCPTPWDYCCIPPERVADATISVRVKGPDGRTVKVERVPELRNLDLVAVRGDLVKDGEDVVLEAKGWYVVERPRFDHEIDWPQ